MSKMLSWLLPHEVVVWIFAARHWRNCVASALLICAAASCVPQYHVIVGDAVDTILAIAQRESATLIVVGARGMSGAERLVFGSTTEGLLRQSGISVLVVPESWTPPKPEAPGLSGTGPVIAGIDMTCPSVDAAAAATRLAAVLKTEAVLVHVVPELRVPERWRAHADSVLRERLEESRRDLERVVKGLNAVGPVRLQIEAGSVPHRLAEAAHVSPHAMARSRACAAPARLRPAGSDCLPRADARARARADAHSELMRHIRDRTQSHQSERCD
jgi:hypothetical protein